MKIKKKKPSRFTINQKIKKATRVPVVVKVDGVCFQCDEKSVAMHECLTCEKLHEETHGKHEKFAVFTCQKHNAKGLTAVKRHALVKHPMNLLRVVAAGLKGEEI